MESLIHVAVTLPQGAVCQAKGPQNKKVRCAYQDRSQLGNKAKKVHMSYNSYSWNFVVGKLLLEPLENGAPPNQLIIRLTKESVTAKKGL